MFLTVCSPKELVPEGQLGFDLVEGRLGDTDAARVGEGLEPSCDVHPVAVDPVTFLDHVPEVHPDAEQHAPVLGQLGVARLQLLLHRHGALHGIHDTGELRQEVVPGRVHHPAAVLLDEIGEYLLVGFEGPDGGRLVVLHQAAVAGHVGAQDGGELAVEAL